MYAVNMELHRDGRAGTAFEQPIDVDEHYVAEMADRALVLDEDPLRCQSLPHMELAGWDTLELLMSCKAESYPEWFSLNRGRRRLALEQPPARHRAALSLRRRDDAPLRPAPSTSPARRRATSACSTSAGATSGWTPAWSRRRPTGRSTSTSA